MLRIWFYLLYRLHTKITALAPTRYPIITVSLGEIGHTQTSRQKISFLKLNLKLFHYIYLPSVDCQRKEFCQHWLSVGRKINSGQFGGKISASVGGYWEKTCPDVCGPWKKNSRHCCSCQWLVGKKNTQVLVVVGRLNALWLVVCGRKKKAQCWWLVEGKMPKVSVGRRVCSIIDVRRRNTAHGWCL